MNINQSSTIFFISPKQGNAILPTYSAIFLTIPLLLFCSIFKFYSSSSPQSFILGTSFQRHSTNSFLFLTILGLCSIRNSRYSYRLVNCFFTPCRCSFPLAHFSQFPALWSILDTFSPQPFSAATCALILIISSSSYNMFPSIDIFIQLIKIFIPHHFDIIYTYFKLFFTYLYCSTSCCQSTHFSYASAMPALYHWHIPPLTLLLITSSYKFSNNVNILQTFIY